MVMNDKTLYDFSFVIYFFDGIQESFAVSNVSKLRDTGLL